MVLQQSFDRPNIKYIVRRKENLLALYSDMDIPSIRCESEGYAIFDNDSDKISQKMPNFGKEKSKTCTSFSCETEEEAVVMDIAKWINQYQHQLQREETSKVECGHVGIIYTNTRANAEFVQQELLRRKFKVNRM